jgi:DNA-binding PadR family transcriptional regulator
MNPAAPSRVPARFSPTTRTGSPGVALAETRAQFVLHPATLGQMLDRLAAHGLVTVGEDPEGRRRRLVELTPRGRRLTEEAPLAGPARPRHCPPLPTAFVAWRGVRRRRRVVRARGVRP